MMNNKISLEYCHITSSVNWKEQIIKSSNAAKPLLDIYQNSNIQKCIMIDDVHFDNSINVSELDSFIGRMEIKPETIFLESEFVFLAQEVLTKLDTNKVSFRNEKEKTWLKSIKNNYDSYTEFSVKWLKGNRIAFSCPLLTATSYICRLGIIDSIPMYWGKRFTPSDNLVQILDKRYFEVEYQAQLILKAFDEKLIDRMKWHFY